MFDRFFREWWPGSAPDVKRSHDRLGASRRAQAFGLRHQCSEDGDRLNRWIGSGLMGDGLGSAESIDTVPTRAGERAPYQPCIGRRVGFVPPLA